MDLFDYPHNAGYQRTDTSYAAAKSIDAKTLQGKVLASIRRAGSTGLNLDELVTVSGIDRHSCQPRTSELRAQGLIKDSGLRRELASSRKGICWVAT